RHLIGTVLIDTRDSILAVGFLHASFNAAGQLSAAEGGWQFLPALVLLTLAVGVHRRLRPGQRVAGPTAGRPGRPAGVRLQVHNDRRGERFVARGDDGDPLSERPLSQHPIDQPPVIRVPVEATAAPHQTEMITMSTPTQQPFAGRAARIGLWAFPLYGLLLGLSTITHQPSVDDFDAYSRYITTDIFLVSHLGASIFGAA